MVDFDSQQNLSMSLLSDERLEALPSLYDSIKSGAPMPVTNISQGLDLVPAVVELARAEIDLSTRIAREQLLRNMLQPLMGKYDYILIDCPPALGLLTINALTAADELLLPLTGEALPLRGLVMLEGIVREVAAHINPRLHVGGVVITRYNNRKLNRSIIDSIRARYGNRVFSTLIRENIQLAEAPLMHSCIYDYAPDSNGAADYLALARELLSRT